MLYHASRTRRVALSLLSGTLLLAGAAGTGPLQPAPVAAEQFASPAFARLWGTHRPPSGAGQSAA